MPRTYNHTKTPDSTLSIEIYEWHEKCRPGTEHRLSDYEIARVNPLWSDIVPQIGDLICLSGHHPDWKNLAPNEEPDFLRPTPYRVIDRQFTWVAFKADDRSKPMFRCVLCLFVRKITDDDYMKKDGAQFLRSRPQ